MVRSSELSLPPASAGFLLGLLFVREGGGGGVFFQNAEVSLNYVVLHSR
jgi:hypothetical protein